LHIRAALEDLQEGSIKSHESASNTAEVELNSTQQGQALKRAVLLRIPNAAVVANS